MTEIAKVNPAGVPAVANITKTNIPDSELLIPRVELTQALTPSVVEGKVRPGVLINSVTKQPLTGDLIMPIMASATYIRWNAREKGGGILYRSNDPHDERVIEDTKWQDNEKPLCTAYLNFLCLLEGESFPIVASFSRSSYQAGRKLFSMIRGNEMKGFRYFDTKYRLIVVPKKKDNIPYFAFDVEQVGPSTEEERLTAWNVYTSFRNVTDINADLSEETDG